MFSKCRLVKSWFALEELNSWFVKNFRIKWKYMLQIKMKVLGKGSCTVKILSIGTPQLVIIILNSLTLQLGTAFKRCRWNGQHCRSWQTAPGLYFFCYDLFVPIFRIFRVWSVNAQCEITPQYQLLQLFKCFQFVKMLLHWNRSSISNN